jgi:branched-subunit amino acid aminotransferase/4-amino-4-deoxychorismate lyase
MYQLTLHATRFTRSRARFEFGRPHADQVIEAHDCGQHDNNDQHEDTSSGCLYIAGSLPHVAGFGHPSRFTGDEFAQP